MMTASSPDLQIVTNTPRCVHHWVLGDPTSGLILGECRRCKATKVFPASPDGTERFDDYRELTTGGGAYQPRGLTTSEAQSA